MIILKKEQSSYLHEKRKIYLRVPHQIISNNIDIPIEDKVDLFRFESDPKEKYGDFGDELALDFISALMNKTYYSGSVLYNDAPDVKIRTASKVYEESNNANGISLENFRTRNKWAGPAHIELDFMGYASDYFIPLTELTSADRSYDRNAPDSIPNCSFSSTPEMSIFELNKKGLTIKNEYKNKLKVLKLGSELYDNNYCRRVYLSAINTDKPDFTIEDLRVNINDERRASFLPASKEYYFNIIKIENCNDKDLKANLIFNSIRIPMKVTRTVANNISYIIQYPEYLLNQTNIIENKKDFIKQIEGIEFISNVSDLCGDIYINKNNPDDVTNNPDDVIKNKNKSYEVTYTDAYADMSTLPEYTDNQLSNSHMIYSTGDYSEYYQYNQNI